MASPTIENNLPPSLAELTPKSDEEPRKSGVGIVGSHDVEQAVLSTESGKTASSGKFGTGISLTRVSKMYDIDGDGKLDEAEQRMRDMDTTGRGYLTKEKVYGLMREHIEMQKEMFKFKKVIIGLVSFVVLLTLCNLGTSFAAASLAKETTTNTNNQLVRSGSNEAVSTQSTSEIFVVEVDEEEVASNGNGERDLETETVRVSSYLSFNANKGNQLITLCSQDATVDVQREWGDGTFETFRICPQDGTFTPEDRDAGTWLGMELESGVTVTKRENGRFTIAGDQFIQYEGEICSRRQGDCDEGLHCNMCVKECAAFLCEYDDDGNYVCETDSFELDFNMGAEIVDMCNSETAPVKLKRNWLDGSFTTFDVCPSVSGVSSTLGEDECYDMTYSYYPDAGEVYMSPHMDNLIYYVNGDGIIGKDGDKCDQAWDCQNLSCKCSDGSFKGPVKGAVDLCDGGGICQVQTYSPTTSPTSSPTQSPTASMAPTSSTAPTVDTGCMNDDDCVHDSRYTKCYDYSQRECGSEKCGTCGCENDSDCNGAIVGGVGARRAQGGAVCAAVDETSELKTCESNEVDILSTDPK